ncbi:MAG: serine/threonine-protein kinase [Microbacterium pygmaeum]
MTPSSDPGSPLIADRPAAAAGGEVLGGRYTLGPRLGEGGMGVVYRAQDGMLRRTVAVKVFRGGPAESGRTATEVHLLAGLNHPSLVTLYDAHMGEVAPRYLVMEYVDGPTLGERLAQGPLSADTVAGMARDLGDALHAVHAAGIVHRDIKPSNVLLRPSTVPGEEFHAKLADFGIAYLIDSTRFTAPGLVVGSAAYLSPEQVTGAEPAPAADIYALGLLLIECLTGRRAFAQTGLNEALIVRLTQDPVIPTSVGNGWGALLTKMTDRDPAKRPTAREVVRAVADLRSADAGPETVAVDPGVIDPGPLTTRVMTSIEPAEPVIEDARHGQHVRWLLAFIAATVIAIVAVIGLIAWNAAGAGVGPPSLPTLQEPMHSHLQQLLDAVTP